VFSVFMWFGFSLNIAMQFLTFRAVDPRYDFKRFASESLDKNIILTNYFPGVIIRQTCILRFSNKSNSGPRRFQMSVQIIVDSTVDMPDRIKECFRIVPLTVHFGGEEFIDGVTIDKARFYERLVESDACCISESI